MRSDVDALHMFIFCRASTTNTVSIQNADVQSLNAGEYPYG